MKKIVFLSIIVLLAVSCGKYEDGPSISLKSKTKRLSREWKVEKVVENGIDITENHNQMSPVHTLLFMEYGSLKETINSTILAKGWSWGEDKETIIVTYSLLSVEKTQTWFIRRLTSKEFWYTVTDEGKDYEYHWKVNK